MSNEPKIQDAEVVEDTKEIVASQSPSSLPSFPTKDQITEYQEFLSNYDNFIASVLNESVDFGKVPGVEKPSLFKPGAEKLEKLMFLNHEKVCIEKIVTDKFISYTYQTRVYDKNGNLKATCEGNCNSKEKKYRSVTVFENQATPEEKERGKKVQKESKAGKPYWVYIVEKEDYYDLQNTIMKMAQKRSYVGAILEATNSSGRFTQDIEDMDLPKNPPITTPNVEQGYSRPPVQMEEKIPTITEEQVNREKTDEKLKKDALLMQIDNILKFLQKDRSWLKEKYNIDLDKLGISGLDQVANQLNGLSIKAVKK